VVGVFEAAGAGLGEVDCAFGFGLAVVVVVLRTITRGLAVVGGGASAMDAAATALENGAARVDLLIRRKELPRINKGKGAGNPGMAHGFASLPDEWKWRFRHYLNVQQVPPPQGSTLRVSRHPHAFFHLGAAASGASLQRSFSGEFTRRSLPRRTCWSP